MIEPACILQARSLCHPILSSSESDIKFDSWTWFQTNEPYVTIPTKLSMHSAHSEDRRPACMDTNINQIRAFAVHSILVAKDQCFFRQVLCQH